MWMVMKSTAEASSGAFSQHAGEPQSSLNLPPARLRPIQIPCRTFKPTLSAMRVIFAGDAG
jgi:hypothetical protein